MKYFVFLFVFFLLASCASQRQKPVCAEIEYRLNHTAMSPDQREWTREELRQCREEQAEYEKTDTLTNKIKKSIYEMYADSKKDSTKANMEKKENTTPSVVNKDSADSKQLADTVSVETP